jgi:hypothetical protein
MLPQIAVFARLVVTQVNVVLPRIIPCIRCRAVQGNIGPLIIKLADIAFTTNGTRKAHQFTPRWETVPSNIGPKIYRQNPNITAP